MKLWHLVWYNYHAFWMNHAFTMKQLIHHTMRKNYHENYLDKE